MGRDGIAPAAGQDSHPGRELTPGDAVGMEAAGRSRSAPQNASEGRGSTVTSRSSRKSSPARLGSFAADKRVEDLERKLAQQDERTRQLFAQQLAEPNEDVSSAYVVLDEAWHKLSKSTTDNRCSWLNINALKKREVSEIIRVHSVIWHVPTVPLRVGRDWGDEKSPRRQGRTPHLGRLRSD